MAGWKEALHPIVQQIHQMESSEEAQCILDNLKQLALLQNQIQKSEAMQDMARLLRELQPAAEALGNTYIQAYKLLANVLQEPPAEECSDEETEQYYALIFQRLSLLSSDDIFIITSMIKEFIDMAQGDYPDSFTVFYVFLLVVQFLKKYGGNEEKEPHVHQGP